MSDGDGGNVDEGVDKEKEGTNGAAVDFSPKAWEGDEGEGGDDIDRE